MDLVIKSFVLAVAFAAGFWVARDAQTRDWAYMQVRATASTLLHRAIAVAPAWRLPEPPVNPLEPPVQAQAIPEQETVATPAPDVVPPTHRPRPNPEDAYIDALRIIESGPADHGVRL